MKLSKRDTGFLRTALARRKQDALGSWWVLKDHAVCYKDLLADQVWLVTTDTKRLHAAEVSELGNELKHRAVYHLAADGTLTAAPAYEFPKIDSWLKKATNGTNRLDPLTAIAPIKVKEASDLDDNNIVASFTRNGQGSVFNGGVDKYTRWTANEVRIPLPHLNGFVRRTKARHLHMVRTGADKSFDAVILRGGKHLAVIMPVFKS